MSIEPGQVFIGACFYVGLGIGLWFCLAGNRRSKRDGTRYLHPTERRAMARARLDDHEGLCSEQHEREFARSMPAFRRFQEIGKRRNLTLADKFFIAAQLQDPRAAQSKPPTKVANISGRSRRK